MCFGVAGRSWPGRRHACAFAAPAFSSSARHEIEAHFFLGGDTVQFFETLWQELEVTDCRRILSPQKEAAEAERGWGHCCVNPLAVFVLSHNTEGDFFAFAFFFFFMHTHKAGLSIACCLSPPHRKQVTGKDPWRSGAGPALLPTHNHGELDCHSSLWVEIAK